MSRAAEDFAKRIGLNTDGPDVDLPTLEEKRKGYISMEFTVWCGNCSQWESWPLSKGVIKSRAAKAHGWRFHKATGWLCQDCEARYQKGLPPDHKRNTFLVN